MIKGILHCHSNFSYDGHNSIRELAEWGKRECLDFIILTEHDNDFDDEKFDRYVLECQDNSIGIIVAPGIEYSFGSKRHIHINVFGINEFVKTDNTLKDIPRFLKFVKDKGGVSILNHPKSITKEIENVDFSSLLGVELWNTKNDFLYAPDPRAYKLIKTKLFDKLVFLTSDLHKIPKADYASLVSQRPLENLESIVNVIKKGEFYCTFNKKRIESSYERISINKVQLYLSGLHHRTYRFLRKIKRIFGISVSPKTVKMIKLK